MIPYVSSGHAPPLVRGPKGLWRLANTRTVCGDLFNRPVCGFV
jgi:hypothetical protein